MSYPIIDNTTTLNSMDTKIDTINTNVTDLPNQISNEATQTHVLSENVDIGDVVELFNFNGTAKFRKTVGFSSGTGDEILDPFASSAWRSAYDETNNIIMCVQVTSSKEIFVSVGEPDNDSNISWNTPVEYTGTNKVANYDSIGIAFDESAGTFVVAYVEYSTNDFFCVGVTVSGIIPTFGTAFQINANTHTSAQNNNIFVEYVPWLQACAIQAPLYSTARIYTVSVIGTTFTNGNNVSVTGELAMMNLDYDNERIVLSYIYDDTDLRYASYINSTGINLVLQAGAIVKTSSPVFAVHSFGSFYDHKNETFISLFNVSGTSSYLHGVAYTLNKDSSLKQVSDLYILDTNTWYSRYFAKSCVTTRLGKNYLMIYNDLYEVIFHPDDFSLSMSVYKEINVGVGSVGTHPCIRNVNDGKYVITYRITDGTTKFVSIIFNEKTGSNAYGLMNESGLVGESKSATLLAFPGSLVSGLSSLTPAAKYYISDETGLLDTKKTDFTIGTAESDTKLLIKYNYFMEQI